MTIAPRAYLRRRGGPDYFVVIAVFVLALFGLVMLASASSHIGKSDYGDAYYFVKHQFFSGFLPGLIGFFAALFISYRRYEKLAVLFLIVALTLLVLVFTPLGIRTGGALRWLALGPVRFQPSEFLKIAFPLYLAAWLSRPRGRERNFVKGFLPFLIVCGTIAGLLLAQRSTSVVAILLATAVIVYFVSGAKLSYLAWFGAVAAVLLALIITVTPYRRERILQFLEPESAPLSGGFHLRQALIAIGSGGLTGSGYGQSTTKLRYLPEPIGDSFFAVIAEELGFVGSISVLALFFSLVARMFLMALKTRDRFAHLILIGFGSLIAIQTLIHIGAISGLLPMTGVPLPFMSYGGTALTVFLTMAGVVGNISRYTI